MKKLFFYFIIIFFVSCADVTPIANSSAGRSVLKGVSTQAVKEVADVLTPHFNLVSTPISICTFDLDKKEFFCKITPCLESNVCTKSIPRDEFLQSNPIILDYESTLHIIKTVKTFCTKNDCKKLYGKYSKNNKFLIVGN